MYVHAGGDILDGSPAGQREAARRALQAQGVEIIADALVTRVERASSAEHLVTEQPSSSQPASSGPSSSPQEPYRKAVHVKVAGSQSKARPLLPRHCPQQYLGSLLRQSSSTCVRLACMRPTINCQASQLCAAQSVLYRCVKGKREGRSQSHILAICCISFNRASIGIGKRLKTLHRRCLQSCCWTFFAIPIRA